MSLTSLPFWIFTAIVLCTYYASASVRYRQIILLIATILFIGSFAARPLSAVPLTVFVLTGYGCIRYVEKFKSGAGPAAAIAGFVLLFIWLKHYSLIAFAPTLPFAYFVVGLSYMLFRILHLMIEVRDGRLRAPSPGDYILYVCFFPSFVSGPIQRFEEFDAQLKKPAPVNDDVALNSFLRIIKGFWKVVVFAEMAHTIQHYFMSALSGAVDASVPWHVSLYLALAAISYLVYLYLNFSGSMDFAIPISRLFGLGLPENFNRPWEAENFLDLWSRWHITLSAWFRTYFFNPILKAMVHRWNAPSVAPYLAVIAFFLTFLVLGAWHGASSEFLLSGLFFGLGVSINQLYQTEMKRRLGRRRYRVLAKTPAYIVFSQGLTMAYFALALTTFWATMAQMKAVASTIGTAGILASLIGLALVLSGIIGCVRLFGSWRITGLLTAHAAPKSLLTWSALAGFALVALIILVPWLNSAPTFVYQGF